ncbi:PREDICTED: chromatin assembly factor 1 subunit A-like [Cyphomyrmex costatus]|uniref:chromatin assembly factor 1 subunit A-like n=1 Tax=Cyphomyrmex costatus TaxID=456900 RepID=UPI000852269A|nr:PREDICTED: chromatin assembly factor 1 subunit A-like [Cyphomyrmex costatus]
MREVDKRYTVTGLQCSTKFSGLKRTYKNIYYQNKKSGNSNSSWGFYSVMDSLIGEKAYIKPLAEASSEGPAPPKLVDTSSASSSPLLLSKKSPNGPKKRRVENILENFINDLKCEKENDKKQRDEKKKKREEERQARYQERKKKREQMHNDNIQIQKSLLDVMRTLANKK